MLEILESGAQTILVHKDEQMAQDFKTHWGTTTPATLKVKKVKKKAQSLAVRQVLTISPSGTGLDCIKLTGNKNISINKSNGTVTVKKKTKKGTYSVKIQIRSTGSAQYKASDYQTVVFKIKIK